MNTPAWLNTVRRVAIFRALNLGDMLCAVPALRAVRRRLPHAHIALIGLESAKPVLDHFPGYIDEWIEFPGDEAFPERRVDHARLPGFFQEMQQRNFDLVIQMHGSGPRSNEIVQAMQARQWVGFVSERVMEVPGQLLMWPDHLHEIHRYLALMQHVGLGTDGDSLEFPLTRDDLERSRTLAGSAGLELERTVLLHAGARLRSRRWPVERFAAVGRQLTQDGWQVALTGSPAESEITSQLASSIGSDCVDLSGATDLGTLAALLHQSRLLVCNDTGISHVAAAVKLRSVVIASGSDVRRWAPLDTRRHTVLFVQTACRPCAYDVCPFGHVCALSVTEEQVLAEARRHLREVCVQ